MPDHLTFAPTADPRQLRATDGTLHEPPARWEFLPAGDPGLTRRVKAAGLVWVVAEKRGRKTFTRGLWADATTIAAARTALETERANPAYAKRLAAAARRRAAEQSDYIAEFRQDVRDFLAFAGPFTALADRLADAVTAHATPVGSGTVARTRRIPVGQRAAAAVIAWLRHQTTAYDSMTIAGVKGRRRDVRRQLAEASRRLLDGHRGTSPHADPCPLCAALSGGTSGR
jgi:hypothetical protein